MFVGCVLNGVLCSGCTCASGTVHMENTSLFVLTIRDAIILGDCMEGRGLSFIVVTGDS